MKENIIPIFKDIITRPPKKNNRLFNTINSGYNNFLLKNKKSIRIIIEKPHSTIIILTRMRSTARGVKNTNNRNSYRISPHKSCFSL